MRASIFLATALACLSVSQASRAWDFIDGYSDTTVYIENTSYDNALVVNVGGYSGKAIIGTSSSNVGIEGVGPNEGVRGTGGNSGVVGTGYIGVFGGGSVTGVRGDGTSDGVIGYASTGHGVQGYGVYAGGGFSADYQGVRAQSTQSGGYGVLAYTDGDYSTAVYAYNNGLSSYAGIFDGDVMVNGSCNPCSPSDEKFKKNVKDIDGALDKVMALKPKSYQMKTEEFKDKITLAKGNQYGFLAQELEAVIPDMVHQAKIPARLTQDEVKNHVKKEPFEFKGVAYTELIPILVRAIQEQQVAMEKQQAEIEALKAAK